MISYDNIKEIIEPILRERSEVIVAYLYGSFLDSSNYNDLGPHTAHAMNGY